MFKVNSKDTSDLCILYYVLKCQTSKIHVLITDQLVILKRNKSMIFGKTFFKLKKPFFTYACISKFFVCNLVNNVSIVIFYQGGFIRLHGKRSKHEEFKLLN